MFSKINYVILLLIVIFVDCQFNSFNRSEIASVHKPQTQSYKYYRKNVTSEASATYLLGLIPLDDTKIYTKAYFRLKNQLPKGNYRLVNLTKDYSHNNYAIYSVRTCTLTADIVKDNVLNPDKEVEEMIFIPGGSFILGGESNEADRDETPGRQTNVKEFWIDPYEVTVGKYRVYCKEIDKRFPSQPDTSEDNHPVVNVDFEAAKKYCEHYEKRLPNEIEWEYAAGGEDHAKWSLGNTFIMQNYCFNRIPEQGACPVGSYLPNSWGVYDMSGNVWEWTDSYYTFEYIHSIRKRNKVLKKKKLKERVIRGGSWNMDDLNMLRTNNRNGLLPAYYNTITGFRCVKDSK